MNAFVFSQLCFVAGLQLSVKTASPVEKVVELIKELKTKMETDEANEQKIYNKFACWCETTTKRKANAIDTGKATIGTSTTTILMQKGTIATKESEIAGLQEAIEKTTASMKKLTSIREKENSEYQSQKDYMETTLSSLHKAIQVLSGAGTGGDMALLKVAAQVRSKILEAPQLDALSDKSSHLLKIFFEDPVSFMQGKQEPVDYYDKAAQAKASYSPQSATVTGVLKDMYDTFSADLEKSNQEESNLQKAFEDEIAVKETSNKLNKENIVMKETEKADTEKLLDEEEQKLAATQTQLKLDEDIFSETRTSCKDKSDDWDARQLARTEQMVGVNKALEVLTSDSARETFEAATGTRAVDTFGSEGVDVDFVQIDSESDPQKKAFHALQKVIGDTNNLKLARIAASVKTATRGHFDVVISEIDGQLNSLHEEGEADVEQRDWCILEQNTEERNKSDQQYLISQLEAKIERAKTKRAKLVKEKEQTEAANVTLAEMYTQATQDRIAESAAYEAAKADDIAAIGLLADATAALSSYGENMAFLQVAKKHKKKLHKQPVFEVSEDEAPDAAFSSSDNHEGGQNSILNLMTQIKEDLESEVALAVKSEAKAVLEFGQLTNSTNAQHAAYTEQITGLDGSIASTDADIQALQQSKSDTNGELTATQEYLDRINPNCEWIKGAFTKRAEARVKEAHGLMEAKASLAGAAIGFLQGRRLMPVA
jgi:hypothetical protein